MIQSMTGYGKAVAEFPDKKVTIEIKSLNSKGLDIASRIAPLYREKEMEIRKEIGYRLKRGKIDFNLWVEVREDADQVVPINQSLVKSYYKQINEISIQLNIPLPSDWFQILLKMPEVMSKVEIKELSEEEWSVVKNTIEEAIMQLIQFRTQEGAALEEKFKKSIHRIQELLTQIDPYEKERVEKLRERLVEALESIPSVEYDKNRLEQELIYYIERLDVNEEKQRLTNHLTYFLKTLNEEEDQGKKLGFISQEIGREINTLGSKANQAAMQKIVVQMKDELEQIKEQVLNTL
ncbi:MAG: YicC family protein [Bacteroidales bacterium]|nr:YicC family protein [Bacteroidales bacterium]